MREKRGAIQLSINFIIMLIISIVVFGFAIYMLTRIFSFAEDERLRLDQQTESLIESALDRGDRVFIPRERRTIYPGDTEVFGMGILNTLDSGDEDFKVLVQFNKAYDASNTQLCAAGDPCAANINKGLLSTQDPGDTNGLIIEKTIPRNEQKKFLIGVKVPDVDSGTYIYNVYVAYDNTGMPDGSPDGDIKCEDFGGTGTITPTLNCAIPDSDNLYDAQIHKLYVIVP